VKHGKTKKQYNSHKISRSTALDSSREIGDLNDIWEQFKDSVTQAANKALGQVDCKKPQKPRKTLNMIEKMDERRKWQKC